MAFDKNYNAIQLAYRAKFLQLQKLLEKESGQLAADLNRQIQDIIDKYTNKDGVIPKKYLATINTKLDRVAQQFTISITRWLDANITNSANLATIGQDAAAMYYVKALIAQKEIAAGLLNKYSAVLRQQYGAGLNGIAKLVRDQVWQKRWQDGFLLSDRLWATNSTLRQNLHGMIEQCVNQGMSATDFSHAVEQYLTTSGPRWTTAIKPSITGRGSIDYNCLRLARSETNNSYHMAQDLSAQNSAIVKGLKWCLSASHPKEDECDIFATQDLYGLGAGVYPAGQLPTPHP